MDEPQLENVEPAGNRLDRASFRWSGFVLWLLVGVCVGVAVAWLAAMLQYHGHFAPWLLFPVLCGCLLGAIWSSLLRSFQMDNRTTGVAGVVVACLVATLGQHYFSYRTARSCAEKQWEQYRLASRAFSDKVRGLPLAPPDGPIAFLHQQAARGRDIGTGDWTARGWLAWLSWGVDGLLLLGAAVTLVVVAMRRPYRDRGSMVTVSRPPGSPV